MNRPEIPNGKLRPCGSLLQLVVVILREMHRIGRSVDSRLRSKMSDLVILPIFCKVTNSLRGQQQAGSLAGAAPCRKDICRAQRQAHPGWKSGVECEGKSLSDCVSHSKKRRDESLA